MKTKDFQEATANRIVEIFRQGQQKRVLLADEVGLGKTIIASAVIQKVAEMHRSWEDHFNTFRQGFPHLCRWWEELPTTIETFVRI